MTGTELLEQLLELLESQVAGVEFRRAWAPGWGSRLLEKPVVSGQVASHRRSGATTETEMWLSVFGPEASQREETASAVEEAVRVNCPGCGELSREEEQVDSVTKLPFLPLKLVFSSGSDIGIQGLTVILGGKHCGGAPRYQCPFPGKNWCLWGRKSPLVCEIPRHSTRWSWKALTPLAWKG